MAEVLYPTKESVVDFFADIGHELLPGSIDKVYPGVFPERRVVRVDRDFVLKARPSDEAGLAEATLLRSLFASYRYSGSRFPTVESIMLPSGYLILKMSYIGASLGELAQDLGELDYEPSANVAFRGFSASQIGALVERLRREHMQYARQTGRVHLDIKLPRKSVTNVNFNPALERLLLCDAEALGPFNETAEMRFHEQLEGLEEWMFENLLV